MTNGGGPLHGQGKKKPSSARKEQRKAKPGKPVPKGKGRR
jgi:hypothetical protein